MSAIAILRPVLVRLVEPRRVDRKRWTITWRGPAGDVSSGQPYTRAYAEAMAKDCGAAEIVVDDPQEDAA